MYLYLATSQNVVSLVLVREEDEVQRPIYYVSRALKATEIRYSLLEKSGLCIDSHSRELGPIFLSAPHPSPNRPTFGYFTQEFDFV